LLNIINATIGPMSLKLLTRTFNPGRMHTVIAGDIMNTFLKSCL